MEAATAAISDQACVDNLGEPSENSVNPDPPEISEAGTVAKTAAALGAAAIAAATAGCPAPGTGGTPPLLGFGDDYPDVPPPALPENLRRLVQRITYGLNAREAELALDLGYDAYLEYHLDYKNIDDGFLNGRLANFHTLNDTPAERGLAASFQNRLPELEFFLATYLRAAYSRRQLFERMVEFWSDHFNIFYQGEYQLILKPIDDREVIRPHALGNFHDLLSASMHSPAMLLYLDNARSIAEAPNENYARELLELHTRGVDTFTQQDVQEVARALTGWTIEVRQENPNFGRFRFAPEIHDNGAKTILGHNIPAGGGESDGERLIELLSTDPATAPVTANFLARKIAVQFWGYDPPQQLVTEIANAYLSSGGEITAMIRAALAENWLMQAPQKLKRPIHFVVSALRARPSNIINPDTMNYILMGMGQIPFHWAPPNGFPDDLEYWGGYIMPRWTFGVQMLYLEEHAPIDFTPLLESESDEAFIDSVDAHYFNHNMPASHRTELDKLLAVYPNNMYRRMEALSLAAASADFQWY